MKRLFAILLSLCLLLSLCACGQNEVAHNPAENTTNTTTSQTAPTTSKPAESTPPEDDAEDTTPPEDNVEDTTASEDEPGDPTDSITPILYKVTDADGNTAWLFGSIHVGEESFYPLPDYVTSAYENSDALAVEFDIVSFEEDVEAQTSALMQFLYTDGTTILDHIPEELYTKAVAILEEYGYYFSEMDYFCPALWSDLVDSALYENLDADSELGLDVYFLNNAHETGKEIQNVESAEFQYGMMAGFSEELQIILLESALHSYEHQDEGAQSLAELMEIWASGDEEALVNMLIEEPELTSDEEVVLYAEYNDAMMTQRNLAMADFAEDALASGKEVFICVGAAHVVGPGALVDLLTQRGYTVERVLP